MWLSLVQSLAASLRHDLGPAVRHRDRPLQARERPPRARRRRARIITQIFRIAGPFRQGPAHPSLLGHAPLERRAAPGATITTRRRTLA